MESADAAVMSYTRSDVRWMCIATAVLTVTANPPAQQRPAPIIDMHLHALAADAQGPPRLGMCAPFQTGYVTRDVAKHHGR